MTILKTAQDWLDARYAAGAQKLSAACNPIQLKLFLTADKETLVLDCRGRTQKEVRVMKDILHDHIGRYAARSKTDA